LDLDCAYLNVLVLLGELFTINENVIDTIYLYIYVNKEIIDSNWVCHEFKLFFKYWE